MAVNVKHCAWPTPAPQVTTWGWSQEGWDRWGERYRPAEYTGPIHDVAAYEAWLKELRELGS